MAVPPQPALYPSSNDAATSAAIALLIHYFDLAPASAQLLVKKWLASYPAIWVRAAVTEALYQGRYKPVSVEQILSFWQRRGRAIAHFNKEFETIIAVPLEGSFKTETDVAIEGNGLEGNRLEMNGLQGNASAERGEGAATAPAASGSAAVDPRIAFGPQDTEAAIAQNDPGAWAASSGMSLAEAFGTAAESEQSEPGSASAPFAAEAPSSSAPLPRPRLMLPGELPGKDLVPQRKVSEKNGQNGSVQNGNAQNGNAQNDNTQNGNGHGGNAPTASAFLTNRSTPEGQPQTGTDSTLRQPNGLDSILNPRPHPQVTQGPDPALLAEAKSKPIQPPPIGRFTPAADPSGFASRLKTVVQQAVAQTQAGETQLSLETAIASQLASDPVLGQISPGDSGAEADSEDDLEAPDLEAPDVVVAPFADRFSLTNASDPAVDSEQRESRDELDLALDAIALDAEPNLAERQDADEGTARSKAVELEAVELEAAELETAELEAIEAELKAVELEVAELETAMLGTTELPEHALARSPSDSEANSEPSLSNPPPLANSTAPGSAYKAAANTNAEARQPHQLQEQLDESPDAWQSPLTTESDAAESARSDQTSEENSQQLHATAAPSPSAAVAISDVSNLMAGLTHGQQPSSDDARLNGIGIPEPELLGEDDSETSRHQA